MLNTEKSAWCVGTREKKQLVLLLLNSPVPEIVLFVRTLKFTLKYSVLTLTSGKIYTGHKCHLLLTQEHPGNKSVFPYQQHHSTGSVREDQIHAGSVPLTSVFRSAMVRVFIPQKLANTTKQGFFSRTVINTILLFLIAFMT